MTTRNDDQTPQQRRGSALPPPFGELPLSNSQITAHVAIAMISAAMVSILLHEAAHFLAATMQGLPARLVPFGNFVTAPATQTQTIIELLAGPIASVIIAAIAWAVVRGKTVVTGPIMFFAWLGCASAMGSLGYLLLTPFGVGDMGMVATLLGVENTAGWPLLVIAVGATVLLARAYGRWIARLAPHADLPRLQSLSFRPWLIGAPILLLVALVWILVSGVEVDPGNTFAILLGTFAMTVWAPMAMPFTATVPAAECDTRKLALGAPNLAVLLGAVALLVNLALVLIPLLTGA